MLTIYSDSGVGILGVFMLLFGGVGLAACWIIRRVLFTVARRTTAVGAQGMWWAVLPACLVTIAVLAVGYEPPANALFQWRFDASERALTGEATAVLATATLQASARPRWIGFFSVKRIEAHDDQVRFITTDCGVVDACGLIYSPSGPPTAWMEDRFRHLRGSWWHVYEGF
jgi:hypothetical protein